MHVPDADCRTLFSFPDDAAPADPGKEARDMRLCRALRACLVLAAGAAFGDTRAAERHVHGHGDLNLIREGNRIDVHFETPVFNLTGFEYAPETAAEQQLWARVLATLRDEGDRLLQPNGRARCALTGVHFDDPFAARPSEQHYREPTEHDADAPASATHDAGADDHAERVEDHGAAVTRDHTDLHVRYRFDCERAERLRDISVGLFAAFPGLVRLDAIYMSRHRQTAARLTARNVRFRFE